MIVICLGILAVGSARVQADERFWAFQPPADQPLPDVEDRDWAANSLDAFVLAKLEDKDLAEAVFKALDTNGDGELNIPEYLRAWGRWARS